MIDVKELRIGNWVQMGHFHQQWDAYCYTEGIDVYNSEPIPITPEILEKCGFGSRISEDGSSVKSLIYYQQVGNQLYIEIESEELKKGYGNVSIIPETWRDEVSALFLFGSVKHLHQLQNLYFSLTGQELNYTP